MLKFIISMNGNKNDSSCCNIEIKEANAETPCCSIEINDSRNDSSVEDKCC